MEKGPPPCHFSWVISSQKETAQDAHDHGGREPGAMTLVIGPGTEPLGQGQQLLGLRNQVSALSRPLTQGEAWGLKCVSVEWHGTFHYGQGGPSGIMSVHRQPSSLPSCLVPLLQWSPTNTQGGTGQG